MGKSAKKSSLVKSLAIATVVFGLFIIIANLGGLIDKVVIKTTKIGDYKLLSESLLGLNGKKNILLLFMNNAEARTGGGFIGTVGYISIDNGKIKSEPVRSVYYYDHKYEDIGFIDKFSGPYGDESFMNLRNSGLNLDANTNLKRAKSIFELEAGKQVDIVIAITPEILKYLLLTTGPVSLPEYDITINESNITDSLQTEVEFGQDKVAGKDPKTVLSGVASVLIERLSLKSLSELTELGIGMQTLMQQRQIAIYSSSYDLSAFLGKARYDGGLVTFDSDYFMLTENNISVDKSNAFIDRELSRRVDIGADGSVDIGVTIRRTQFRDKSIPYVDPNNNNFTYLIKENASSIEFALPSGSKIYSELSTMAIQPRGKEGGYDIYQFRSDLVPLVPSEYSFSYRLPFKIAEGSFAVFNSFLQLQNGGWPYKLTNTTSTPDSWELSATNKRDILSSGNTVVYNEYVNKDMFLSLVYGKK